MNSQSSYLMESTDENHRLNGKVNSKKFVQQYLTNKFRSFSTILDVGCGPASIAMELAQSFPDTSVFGLDISVKRILEAKLLCHSQINLNLISGDVYNIPVCGNTCDLVYSRLFFEYLKDPLAALKEMKRICKPDGTVMIQDLDGQFFWHYPENNQLNAQIIAIFHDLKKYTGFDPFVGRKLYYMFYDTVFHDIQVYIDPYHLIAGKINSKEYQYWKKKLSTVLPQLIKHSSMKLDEIQTINDTFLAYLQREDTLTFSNLFTVYGRK